jgi:hypothetical protein
MSRRPACGNYGVASPVDTLNSAKYLGLLNLGVCSRSGVSFDQQDGLLLLPPDVHHPVDYDARTRGSIEDYVANVYLGAAGRPHIQGIAIPHHWIHARASSAKAKSVSALQEVDGQFLEVGPPTPDAGVTGHLHSRRSVCPLSITTHGPHL